MDSVNKWLTLAANFGVIVGIVFLIVEVSQQNESIDLSNRIANAQFIAEDGVLRITAYDLRIGEDLPDALEKAIFEPQDITDKDLVILDTYYTRDWMRALQHRNLIQEGFSQTSPAGLSTEWAEQYLNNEIAIKWWHNNQIGLLSTYPELRDAVNERLGESEDNRSLMAKSRLEQLKR